MNLLDRILCEVDTGLRTLFAKPAAARASPAHSVAAEELPGGERAESIRLMRVNHCGEVCAQALYQGQALVARDAATANLLQSAAGEERDHLAWCAARVTELGGKTSLLAPLFYAGSFGLGVASGLLGDKWSLGFLVETERQVEAHLHDHLSRLPAADGASRAVLEAMKADEIRHGDSGESHGGKPLPPPVRAAMRGFSTVMTRSTYWV
jgi:3-demethoxyubiquinol 3-hydroxylase